MSWRSKGPRNVDTTTHAAMPITITTSKPATIPRIGQPPAAVEQTECHVKQRSRVGGDPPTKRSEPWLDLVTEGRDAHEDEDSDTDDDQAIFVLCPYTSTRPWARTV